MPVRRRTHTWYQQTPDGLVPISAHSTGISMKVRRSPVTHRTPCLRSRTTGSSTSRPRCAVRRATTAGPVAGGVAGVPRRTPAARGPRAPRAPARRVAGGLPAAEGGHGLPEPALPLRRREDDAGQNSGEGQRRVTNSSTVRPASRMIARSVPRRTGSCIGTTTRRKGGARSFMVTWLPFRW